MLDGSMSSSCSDVENSVPPAANGKGSNDRLSELYTVPRDIHYITLHYFINVRFNSPNTHTQSPPI